MKTLATTTARVYVGTYHKYNCGNLAGRWLDVDDYTDRDDFYEACAALHHDEQDPEFMFQDWEGIPAGMIAESSIQDEVWEWLALDEDDQELLTVYQGNIDQGGDMDQAREQFRGKYGSAKEFAQEWHAEGGSLANVPNDLAWHIDWAGVARDMRDSFSFVEHNGQTFVFSS